MKSRFDFQDVHRKTGVLILTTITVLVLALFGAAAAQRWWVPVYRLQVDLGSAGAEGLQVGAEVKMLGTVIGRVEKLELLEGAEFVPTVSSSSASGGPQQGGPSEGARPASGEEAPPSANDLLAIANIVLQGGEMVRFVRTDSQVYLYPKGVLEPGYLVITRGVGRQMFSDEVREARWGREKVLTQPDLMEQARMLLAELESQAKVLLDSAGEEGALRILLGEENYRRFARKGIVGLTVGTDTTQRFEEDGLLGIVLGEDIERFRREGALGLTLPEEGSREVLDSLAGLEEVIADLDQQGLLKLALGQERLDQLDAEGLVDWVLENPGSAQELARLLASTTALVERIEQRGLLELALSDPAQAPERGQRVGDSVEELLGSVQRLVAELEPVMASLADEAVVLPGVVAESQETLRQIEILVRAIQQHWLLRSYVDPRPGEGRIPTDQLPLREGR